MNKILVGMLCLLAVSCQQKPAPLPAETLSFSNTVRESFETNHLIPSVSLREYPAENFALFLPDRYSDSAQLPVLIFFDPHGKGTVPLNLYATLANEFGVILLGSNSSKNGLDITTATTIARHLIEDVKTRFYVDTSNITLVGFSGGAKVALATAAENENVKSVVYCGAAIPVQFKHPLTLIGFAGTHDMNYSDVVAFDNDSHNSNLPHYLIEWEGKHEFPAAKVFKDVLVFITKGNIPDYPKKRVTANKEKLRQEQEAKQQLITAFQSQNINWWRNEIKQMKKAGKDDVMYERLLGFVSLACYSFSQQALQQNNLPLAEKILAIYRLADPENKDMVNFTMELERKKANQ